MASYGFSTRLRLHQGREFQQVYRSGRRMGNELFSVNVCRNEQNVARLGLSIAVRTMGGAVARNRLRRLIREHFRLHQAELPPLDVVIGARPRAREASAADVREGLDRLWKRIIAECAP